MSILIKCQIVEKVTGAVHSGRLLITRSLLPSPGPPSLFLGKDAGLTYSFFYYPYLIYNGLQQARLSQIAPFRVRIVMSTLIAMVSIVSDTLYPINVLCRWEESTPRRLPIAGPVRGEKEPESNYSSHITGSDL